MHGIQYPASAVRVTPNAAKGNYNVPSPVTSLFLEMSLDSEFSYLMSDNSEWFASAVKKNYLLWISFAHIIIISILL